MVILAAVKVNFWLAFLAGTTLVVGAAYTLWMYKRVIFGDIANDNVRTLQDLNSREFWLLATVAAAVLLMGVWPKPFIDVMNQSVIDLLAHVAKSKL
jgi:NADH-quinone oxidoreductase subunit M